MEESPTGHQELDLAQWGTDGKRGHRVDGSISCQVADGIYLRIIDLPAVLHARQYAADCDVTLAVTDPLIERNAGTWRIRIARGHADVQRADGDPAATLGVRELAAAYLGGTGLDALGRAGRLAVHDADAFRALSRALAWDRMPHCPDEF